uniref:Uncharacterized protein n=1 Tax=Oryctolagus cuniculus TaxID=9986 RepID=A0A5F9DD02_RABIT
WYRPFGSRRGEAQVPPLPESHAPPVGGPAPGRVQSATTGREQKEAGFGETWHSLHGGQEEKHRLRCQVGLSQRWNCCFQAA